MITQDRLKELFIYKDGSLYRKQSKGCGKQGDKVGTIMIGKQVRYKCCVDNVDYYLHRLIFLYHHGYLPKRIDHINGNPSDNRDENLREATQSENLMNAKLSKTNKSGVKGVCYDKRTKKWMATLMLNKKSLFFGRYATLEEAAKVVQQKRIELHKEFARNE